MKTLLIVEDEKMIRRGIAVMVQRCSVPVDEIIECRNGVEALEILRQREIDVVFTDIRMPKMDGIELVEQIENLSSRPFVIVISGYDDFNYSVSMLKHGVKDYLLKPVKRDKVEEILRKLDGELRRKNEEQADQLQNFKNQIKYFLKTEHVPETEWDSAKRQFDRIFEGGSWRLVLSGHDLEAPCGVQIELGMSEDHRISFLNEQEWQQWKEGCPARAGAGASLEHKDFRECRQALQEALEARKYAFVREKSAAAADEVRQEDGASRIPEAFAAQFIQQFMTDRAESSRKKLEEYFFLARHGKADAGELLDTAASIRTGLLKKCGNLLTEESRRKAERDELYWNSSSEYLTVLTDWMREVRKSLEDQFGEDQNQAKIREAERYIRENYEKDLNMAMVSNHVSMNYSLFSLAFKKYTGMNFVNYLKDIRIAEAKKLLSKTDERIQDISRKVGYDNEKHFMKIFRNLCGISPSEYRKNARMEDEIKRQD